MTSLLENTPLSVSRNRSGPIIVVLALLALASAAGFWYWKEFTKIARLKLVFEWESRAKVLCTEATARDLTITACRNDLSVNAIHQVDRHEVDAAVIPAGLGISGENLRHVTFVDREFLHLFVKPDLLGKGLAGLRGRRIWLGATDSDVRDVAGEVLTYIGLKPGDYQDDSRPFKGMINARLSCPTPSSRLRRCRRRGREARPHVRLPTHGNVLRRGDHHQEAVSGGRDSARRSLLRGACNSQPEVAYDRYSLCDRCTQRRATARHREAAGGLYESDYATNVGIEPLNERLLQRPGEYPAHDGTRAYIHRNDPWLGTWLSGAIHWITGTMLSAVSATLLAWQWFQRRQRKVGELLRQCNGLDLDAQTAASRGQFDERSLGSMLVQLSRMKAEVLKLQHESFSAGDRHLIDIVARIEVLQQTLPTLVRTSAIEGLSPAVPKRRAA